MKTALARIDEDYQTDRLDPGLLHKTNKKKNVTLCLVKENCLQKKIKEKIFFVKLHRKSDMSFLMKY